MFIADRAAGAAPLVGRPLGAIAKTVLYLKSLLVSLVIFLGAAATLIVAIGLGAVAIGCRPGHAGIDLRPDAHLRDAEGLHASTRGLAARHYELSHAVLHQASCDGGQRALDDARGFAGAEDHHCRCLARGGGRATRGQAAIGGGQHHRAGRLVGAVV